MFTAKAAFTSIFLLTLCVFCANSRAATWYCDPINGSAAGDGTQANPWPSLKWVVDNNKIESMKPAAYPYVEGGDLVVRNAGAPVQSGDTIKLLTGDHGDVWIVGYFNTDWIKIEAEAGHTPVLLHMIIRGGRFWHLDGITISREPYGTPDGSNLMEFNTHGWHGPVSDCIIENSHLYSADDSSGWSVQDWQDYAATTAIAGDCKRMIVRNNLVRNIKFGISANKDDSVIEYNTIDGIGHDGYRSGGNNIVWQYNTTRNFVKIDENHDDMIQLYRGGGVAHENVIIRNNYFDGRKDPDNPISTCPQGIGCFDGPYVNCRIENNVVLTSTYHGLSIYGAENCVIINNTVVDTTHEYPAWIAGSGTNNIFRNNISFATPDFDGTDGNVADHNIELTEDLADEIFVSWRGGDVHLAADSPAIDAGSADLAPAIDIDDQARPIGNGIDIGAYEFSASAPMPGDADLDGDVDIFDFLILKANFGTATGATWSQGDFDSNGTVDIFDFLILKANFGATGVAG